jgi:uncharacterized protein (TIGR00725 family)
LTPQWPVEHWTVADNFVAERNQAVEQVREMMISRASGLKAVAVSGSGRPITYSKDARRVGALIARLGYHLLNGGLAGAMEHSTRGFMRVAAPQGIAIGILPEGCEPIVTGRDVSPIYTQLPGVDHEGPSSRNHVLIYCADKVIVLPGAGGTKAEAKMAKQWYLKPTIAYDPDHAADQSWRDEMDRLAIVVVDDFAEVEAFLKT